MLDNQKCQRKVVKIFLPMPFGICFGCSKEPSQCSFKYPQHMFWLRIQKIIFLLRSYPLLTKGLGGGGGGFRSLGIFDLYSCRF